jgi:hypothetical protein
MSTASTPSQASLNAARAASYAGPVVSIAVASPVSTTVSVHSAPQGTCFSRWVRRHSRACAVVSPGATRSENFARADAVSVLLAPSTLGASMPVIVSAGWVHSRSSIGPDPTLSMPATAPDSARSRS